MGDKGFLGEFEQMVLLAVLRLKEGAYGVTVRQEIEKRTGARVSRGAVYITLDRLQKKGYLESHVADPTPERGGRPRRYYKVRRDGLVALRDSRTAFQKMWAGLQPVVKKL